MKKIAFIGLGVMGAPMVRNILKAKFSCRVFDLNKDSVRSMTSQGAKAATSPKDCAQGADLVITMLPFGKIVKEVLLGTDGIVAGMKPDAIAVDMSTILPSETDQIKHLMDQERRRFIDAPVGRSSAHAVSGKLLIMVGGEVEEVRLVRPVLEKMGDTIIHCGPVGSGSRMKVVNNYMSVTLNVTTTESLLLAEGLGIDVELARQVMISTVAGQGHMATTYPAKVLKGDLEPGFPVKFAHKDLKLALAMAQSLTVKLSTGEVALKKYDHLLDTGYGENDWTALYLEARKQAGFLDGNK